MNTSFLRFDSFVCFFTVCLYSPKVPESDVVVTHDSVWMLPMLEEESDDSLKPGIHNQGQLMSLLSHPLSQ